MAYPPPQEHSPIMSNISPRSIDDDKINGTIAQLPNKIVHAYGREHSALLPAKINDVITK